MIEEEIDPNRRVWYVLHVKPRTEKQVVLHLKAHGYFYHLPVYTHVRKVQRRKVRTEKPLFPGYVFTKLNPAERIVMLKTNYIVRTIFVKYPRPMIHQLRQISRASRKKPDFKPVNPYKTGELVRVAFGPFRGVEGYVKREGPKATLCLNVEILGAAVEMSVSIEDLEKV
jgi:transcription antitermination factor NusG